VLSVTTAKDPIDIFKRMSGAELAMPWSRSPYVPQPADAHTASTFFSPGWINTDTLYVR
jgi:hypothetical protein